MSKKKKIVSKIVGSKNLFKKILEDILPDNEELPMKMGKKGLILAVAKQDEGMKQLLRSSSQKVRELCKARLAVKSWKLHIKRINNLTNQAKAKNGYLGIPLHYHSAHTGRWSGAEKINVQNFGKRGRTGSGVHPLIKQVAGLIQAPDGHTFISSDYSQIECRILAWIAGQNGLLKSFQRGEDIYSEFATKLFNSAVYKPDETDPEPVQKLMKIRRGFGKDTILGCGYGMGAKRFYDNCLENNDLRPLFDSGEYNFKFIENLIKTYRKTYFKIPEFWKFCEKAFRWVIKYPNERGHSPIINALEFYNENGTIIIQLPSGRKLRYRHCRIAEADGYSTIQWHWGHLWGGSITENVVQAIARDILAEAILVIHSFNPIICHIHDSLIISVKKNEAKFALPKIEKSMRQNPDWAVGLPIDVESKIQCHF